MIYSIEDIIEKPSLEDAPSSLGTVGRYVFTPQILDCIKQVPIAKNELQLTDAIKNLLDCETFTAISFKGYNRMVG